MPTYLFLCNLTEQGIRGIKQGAQSRQAGRDAIERLGGRVIGNYGTQGRYDVVWLADFPDEAAASAFALQAGLRGNLRTETLRAFTNEEMDAIIAKLPDPGR
jgi:uncharacterized protein with GYD domain